MALAVSLSLLLPRGHRAAGRPDRQPAPLARGYRTRALAGGWGHPCLTTGPAMARPSATSSTLGLSADGLVRYELARVVR